jgi:trehalose synthase
MPQFQEVPIVAEPIDRFQPLLGEEKMGTAKEAAARICKRLKGRVIWNVNSTAQGGGVAEMLHSLLPYVRGMEIDSRWAVMSGTPEFFRVTKRLHHALHGSAGDGSELGDGARAVYERVTEQNADELEALVRPRDFVILHDPQSAGLISALKRRGAIVIWRCHIGSDEPNEQVNLGWNFLARYLVDADVTVFTREQYIPECCDHGRSVIIPPSIDPFSPKNQEMSEATARAILVHTGIVEGAVDPGAPPMYQREDGSPGRVDRYADVLRLGPPPRWNQPLVLQVSRWDPLKDPVGVMHGFVHYLHTAAAAGACLVLAGPNVKAIPDDPEGAHMLDTVMDAWHRLPHSIRSRIHLVSLPMADIEENAAIVNALQRHASVVVQKSLREGFGLTVTEAMWKARPVLASAVGGIQDQIIDGNCGVLLRDPRDLNAFAEHLERLLTEREWAGGLGDNARQRVKEQFLPMRHLLQYADLIERIDA